MKYSWFVIGILLFAGCQGKKTSTSDKAGEEIQALSSHSSGTQSAAQANVLRGKVLEKLDVDDYTYLRLQTASGETWAAVPKAGINVGSEVTMVNPMSMDGFQSKTLKRKFERIVFGTLDKKVQDSEAMQTLYQAHSAVNGTANAGPIKVEKAAGTDDQKGNLRNQKVTVRGQVVKVKAKVMERTWIHLRDGSGSREAKTDDITVTTQGTVSVGDVVLVKGTVQTDKNFGMGYMFPVMIEDATVTKQ
jgi:hypothetical protein